MQTQIHYQNLESTPWMEEFMSSRVAKLSRYLTPAASIQVHLKLVNKNQYETSLSVHSHKHDYAFKSSGENMYESFNGALEKALRVLSEEKKKIKDRIHRKFISPEGDMSLA